MSIAKLEGECRVGAKFESYSDANRCVHSLFDSATHAEEQRNWSFLWSLGPPDPDAKIKNDCRENDCYVFIPKFIPKRGQGPEFIPFCKMNCRIVENASGIVEEAEKFLYDTLYTADGMLDSLIIDTAEWAGIDVFRGAW